MLNALFLHRIWKTWIEGVSSGHDFRKPMIISFVLSALSTRLLSCTSPLDVSLSSLYIDSVFPRMSPTIVVSSANFTIRFPSCLDAQSSVSRVNSRGLSSAWCVGDVVSVVLQSGSAEPRGMRWCSDQGEGASPLDYIIILCKKLPQFLIFLNEIKQDIFISVSTRQIHES